MPTTRVAIAGATGYTGEELIRVLLRHPHVQLAYVAGSAKREQPVPAGELFPQFARRLDLTVESLDSQRLIAACDAAFLALPHGTAMSLVPELLAAGKRVVDLSGDFRLANPAQYPQWYQFTHAHPELLTDARVVYGLTEFHREAIAKAQVVSNPGCYATSVLLGCLPLVKAGLVADGRIIVDAKSGLSGAGRKADESLLFTEMAENLRAYKVNTHQHMPEIQQELARVTGQSPTLMFVPQVIPATRGLVSMIYLRITSDEAAIAKAFAACYTPERTPFSRVTMGRLPQFKDVVGTNDCAIGVVYDRQLECAVIGSALDNLVKGAAGQAVQNFNLMHGYEETTALN